LLASIAWEANAQAPRHCVTGFNVCFDCFRIWGSKLHSIAASGWPWDTTVVVEWTDRDTPADGKDYVNSGVHVIQMRWGKVVSIHAYLDTQVLIDTLTEEAKAPPIIGSLG
jgi:hypothetical protein